jgi:hypothetical protein
MCLAELMAASQQTLKAAAMLKTAAACAPDCVWAARLQCMRGRLLADHERYEKALPILLHSIPVLQRELEARHTETGLARVSFARALAATNRVEEAMRLLEQLCAEYGDPKDPAPTGSLARRTFAQQLAQQGRSEDALVQLLHAVAIEPTLPPIGYVIHEPAANRSSSCLRAVCSTGMSRRYDACWIARSISSDTSHMPVLS